MKRSALLVFVAVSSLVFGTSLMAGGYPGTTRTLTKGISSGTTASRVPESHPYTIESRASHSRNSSADISLSNYRKGYAGQSGSSNTASSSVHGKPSGFPGIGSSHMNTTAIGKTEGKLPEFSSFPPSGSSNPAVGGTATRTGMPSSVTTGQPAALPPLLPDAAAPGGLPATIPPVNASGGMPPALPDAATSRIPDAAAAGLANRGRGRP